MCICWEDNHKLKKIIIQLLTNLCMAATASLFFTWSKPKEREKRRANSCNIHQEVCCNNTIMGWCWSCALCHIARQLVIESTTDFLNSICHLLWHNLSRLQSISCPHSTATQAEVVQHKVQTVQQLKLKLYSTKFSLYSNLSWSCTAQSLACTAIYAEDVQHKVQPVQQLKLKLYSTKFSLYSNLACTAI